MHSLRALSNTKAASPVPVASLVYKINSVIRRSHRSLRATGAVNVYASRHLSLQISSIGVYADGYIMLAYLGLSDAKGSVIFNP